MGFQRTAPRRIAAQQTPVRTGNRSDLNICASCRPPPPAEGGRRDGPRCPGWHVSWERRFQPAPRPGGRCSLAAMQPGFGATAPAPRSCDARCGFLRSLYVPASRSARGAPGVPAATRRKGGVSSFAAWTASKKGRASSGAMACTSSRRITRGSAAARTHAKQQGLHILRRRGPVCGGPKPGDLDAGHLTRAQAGAFLEVDDQPPTTRQRVHGQGLHPHPPVPGAFPDFDEERRLAVSPGAVEEQVLRWRSPGCQRIEPSFRSGKLCRVRPSMASEVPPPATIVVSSLETMMFLARPRSPISMFSSLMPRSSKMAFPPDASGTAGGLDGTKLQGRERESRIARRQRANAEIRQEGAVPLLGNHRTPPPAGFLTGLG